GWGTAALTGSGLLGLAVGHGLTATDETKKKAVKDAGIDNGLKWLGQWVGKNFGDDRNKGGFGIYSPINLYFLWTVERVGMLYNVRQLDGKDWYTWGVKLLLDRQDAAGSWHEQ